MSRISSHVNTSSSEKHQKTDSDYISSLPECVLSIILSLLPLKVAVQTCVLSKDWEFKWTLMYDVNFDIRCFSRKWRNEWSFVYIVDKMVHHLQNVENFRLSCSSPMDQELSRIAMLVSVILRRNVKRLELDICNTQDFFLPRTLLNSASLTKLVLIFETPCRLRVPSKNCLPKLKSFTLERVTILNDISSTDTLVFTFPVLDSIELINCKWVKVKFVEIHAPSLRVFTSLPQSEGNDKQDFNYSIKILGTMIDTLEVGHQENIIMNGSNVNHLNLVCTSQHPFPALEESTLQVRKLLRGLPNLAYLSMRDLQAIGKTKLDLPLPRFHQLKKMHLTFTTPFDAEGLLELLHATPFLKSVVICMDESEDYDYDSVENIPSCVVHYLEKVRVFYTRCPEPKFLVEKFLLKNGAHLKTIAVSRCLSLTAENEIVRKLSTFPKASAFLRITGTSTLSKA